VLLLLALVGLWGTAFMVIRLALDDLSPLEATAARLFVAALVLNLWMHLSGLRYPTDLGRWRHFLVLSLVGSAIPFTAIAWGQQVVTSGTAGLLMGVIPLLTLLLAHFHSPGESMSARQGLGFLMGFAGVAFLMGPDAVKQLGGQATDVIRQGAVLLGALCYAVNAILVRRLPETPPVVSASAVISLAALWFLPILVSSGGEYANADRGGLLAVVWLGAAATAGATVLLYRLIALAGATFASLMNYLIPCVALTSGAAFLGEPVEYRAGFALLLILAGIGISQLSFRT